MLTAIIIINMALMIKTEPSGATDVISYVSFLYRQRSTSCTFSLIWNCVYVFRIPAEILEQTRSASKVSNYRAACFLGCGMHPRPPPAGRMGWLMAAPANSLKKPQNSRPIYDPYPDRFLLNRAGSQEHCTRQQKSNLPARPCSSLRPTPPSPCLF